MKKDLFVKALLVTVLIAVFGFVALRVAVLIYDGDFAPRCPVCWRRGAHQH